MSDTIYLYLKTHNKTGFKYLGKTVQDPHTYKGSGKIWRRHIAKHGYDVTTEVLFESSDKQEFANQCLYYSELFDVVNNKQFANIVCETGGGGDTSTSPAYKAAKENGEFNGAIYKSEECKRIAAIKTSKKLSGRKRPSEVGEKVSKTKKEKYANGYISHRLGAKFSEEQKEKLRMPKQKFVCKTCGKTVGGATNLNRWHNDNCKQKEK